MANQLHIHTKPVKSIFEKNHLRGKSVEHRHSALVARHIYLIRNRGKIDTPIARVLDIGNDRFATVAEMLKRSPEFFYLGNTSADLVRLHKNELYRRVLGRSINCTDSAEYSKWLNDSFSRKTSHRIGFLRLFRE